MVVPGLEELTDQKLQIFTIVCFVANAIVMHGDPLDGVMQEQPVT
jgi:hypothetical protein